MDDTQVLYLNNVATQYVDISNDRTENDQSYLFTLAVNSYDTLLKWTQGNDNVTPSFLSDIKTIDDLDNSNVLYLNKNATQYVDISNDRTENDQSYLFTLAVNSYDTLLKWTQGDDNVTPRFVQNYLASNPDNFYFPKIVGDVNVNFNSNSDISGILRLDISNNITIRDLSETEKNTLSVTQANYGTVSLNNEKDGWLYNPSSYIFNIYHNNIVDSFKCTLNTNGLDISNTILVNISKNNDNIDYEYYNLFHHSVCFKYNTLFIIGGTKSGSFDSVDYNNNIKIVNWYSKRGYNINVTNKLASIKGHESIILSNTTAQSVKILTVAYDSFIIGTFDLSTNQIYVDGGFGEISHNIHRKYFSLVNYNGKIILYGGTDDYNIILGNDLSNTIIEINVTETDGLFNITSSTKLTNGNIPLSRAYHCAELIGDYMYLFSGRDSNGGFPDSLYRLDLTTYTWSLITNDTTNNGSWFQNLISYNNNLYSFSNDESETIFYIDPSTDTSWNKLENAIKTPRKYAKAVINNSEIILVGGSDYYDNTLNYISSYNLSTNIYYDYSGNDQIPTNYTINLNIQTETINGYTYPQSITNYGNGKGLTLYTQTAIDNSFNFDIQLYYNNIKVSTNESIWKASHFDGDNSGKLVRQNGLFNYTLNNGGIISELSSPFPSQRFIITYTDTTNFLFSVSFLS